MEVNGCKFSQMAIGNEDSVSINLGRKFSNMKNCMDDEHDVFFTPNLDHANPTPFFQNNNFTGGDQKPLYKKIINSAPHDNMFSNQFGESYMP